MKIHTRGKFHQNSICDCEVKCLGYRFSIHEMTISGRFLGPYFPKYGPTLQKFSSEVVF